MTQREQASIVDCAVITATNAVADHEDVLVAIAHRAGRHPVFKLDGSFNGCEIGWQCQDRATEWLGLAGTAALQKSLKDRIDNGGLLVAEFLERAPGMDLHDAQSMMPDGSTVVNWWIFR